MKDLSYLKVFSLKTLREARRVLEKGFTVEDISRFLEPTEAPMSMIPRKKELMRKMGWELKKPCGGCKDKKKEAE